MLACKPTATKKCKPLDEINEWVADHAFFFISQKTDVIPDFFDDSPNIEKWPNEGDPATYFPVKASMRSTDFGPINFRNKKYVPSTQINYGF